MNTLSHLWKKSGLMLLALSSLPAGAMIDDVPINYSYCGYGASERNIPTFEHTYIVPRQEGDMTDILQAALDTYDGNIQLEEGTYVVSGRLKFRHNQLVLRGAGADKTKLVFQGVNREPGILIEGEPLEIGTDTIRPNADGKWEVYDTEGLAIIHASTKEWIAQHGCDIYGGGISALGWKPGDVDITYLRNMPFSYPKGPIQKWEKEPDAPLPLNWGKDEVFGFKVRNGYERRFNCGVEDLTIVAEVLNDNPKDEQHLWTGISIENAQDCWVSRVNFENLAGSGVIVQPHAQRITVEDCIYRHPVSEEANLRRNAFYILGQQVLVQRCVADHAMHAFATGWGAAGPNAFVQCEAREALSYSGAVEAWSTGLLMDLVDIDGHDIMMANIDQDNNGSGWTCANGMCWNCTAAEIHCASPDTLNPNRAYGTWCQFSGNGIWKSTNNHIKPRSLFYAQLEERLKGTRDSVRLAYLDGHILPRNLEASSSPTYEQAALAAKEAREIPRLTLEKWISDRQQSRCSAITNYKEQITKSKGTKDKGQRTKDKGQRTKDKGQSLFALQNGKLLRRGETATGGKYDAPWWSGKTRPNFLANKAKPALTRHVPDREGLGLTDRIDSVVAYMERNNILAYDQCYGLWYDRRRDDHERIRRRDAECWAPFYEQPWDRTGQGTAWEGLSRYDLTRPNVWYYSRLKEFCQAAPDRMLYLQHYFQHNILEAGAHWVDCPWRPVNNVNETVFPEPVPFTGDKRVFVAEWFYDEQNPTMRALHRQYIRENLEQFRGIPNVVHHISNEYTGPLHFTKFWLECIAEWEAETGEHPLVALACTKDVQDSLLADPKLSKVIDIIEIQYWFYRVPDKRNPSDIWAPGGGLNLAPRQHMRRQPVGKTGFEEAYKSVYEYTSQYPDKAVTFYAQTYNTLGWAILMAGGSGYQVDIQDATLRQTLPTLRPQNGEVAKALTSDQAALLYFTADGSVPVSGLTPGKYTLYSVTKEGATQKLSTLKVAADGIATVNGENNKILFLIRK